MAYKLLGLIQNGGEIHQEEVKRTCVEYSLAKEVLEKDLQGVYGRSYIAMSEKKLVTHLAFPQRLFNNHLCLAAIAPLSLPLCVLELQDALTRFLSKASRSLKKVPQSRAQLVRILSTKHSLSLTTTELTLATVYPVEFVKQLFCPYQCMMDRSGRHAACSPQKFMSWVLLEVYF
ncbi:hypothetical protein J6590_074269 [Homalodisca vitripennis]|nr:hypothetical protein J6590_074269 [Homalodisca vitripennis]